MQLKLLQIQELQQLQARLVAKNDEINRLKQLMEQLLHDHCDVHVSFKMENLTKKHNEAAKKEAEEMLMDPMEKMYRVHYRAATDAMGGISAIISYGRQTVAENMQFQFSEADALLLLNTILVKRREEKKHIVDQMRRITKNAMASFLYLDEEDPIK